MAFLETTHLAALLIDGDDQGRAVAGRLRDGGLQVGDEGMDLIRGDDVAVRLSAGTIDVEEDDTAQTAFADVADDAGGTGPVDASESDQQQLGDPRLERRALVS